MYVVFITGEEHLAHAEEIYTYLHYFKYFVT